MNIKSLGFCFLILPIYLSSQEQNNQSVSVQFIGLSFHPKGAFGNENLMPRRIDNKGYFILNLGGIIAYEKSVYQDIIHLKVLTGLYADCADQTAGFISIGARFKIFSYKKHYLEGGLGPTFIFRKNWFSLPHYEDTHYYKGNPDDKWQYKFIWYGGEFEYRYLLNKKMSLSISFIPGYPHLMCLTTGINYRL